MRYFSICAIIGLIFVTNTFAQDGYIKNLDIFIAKNELNLICHFKSDFIDEDMRQTLSSGMSSTFNFQINLKYENGSVLRKQMVEVVIRYDIWEKQYLLFHNDQIHQFSTYEIFKSFLYDSLTFDLGSITGIDYKKSLRLIVFFSPEKISSAQKERLNYWLTDDSNTKESASKIFVFICLLLIFPAIPLSIFIMQLLEKSYRIGVNERVESALDGALQISTDLYQMHREQLQKWIDKIQQNSAQDVETIKKEIIKFNPNIKYYFRSIDDPSPGVLTYLSIQKLREENKKNVIWPDAEHTRLYGVILLNDKNILEVEYPLPESFQAAAKSIQDVNQIYKTLGFVQSDIRRSFLFTFLSIYLLGVILALIISYFISKRITRPIEQLVLAAEEVGKGNLSYQIPIKGNDEFAVLGSAFNRMVVDLDDNQRRIIELEKMASWQQLARKLAHEIKNPLTPIQLMAQQMRDKYAGENKQYEKLLTDCCTIIEDEVESLQRLVREFSDFARLPEFKLMKQDILPLFESIKKLYNHTNLKVTVQDG
ncbi:MAG: HAMP domain-containing protein, partial [Calditrichaceae bacterium]